MIHQVHLVAYLVAYTVPNSSFLLHPGDRSSYTSLWESYLFCESMPNSRALVYSLLVIFGEDTFGSRGDPRVPADILVMGESKVNS